MTDYPPSHPRIISGTLNHTPITSITSLVSFQPDPPEHQRYVLPSFISTHTAAVSVFDPAPKTRRPPRLPSRFKKPDASEAKIRLNEGRFKRLLRALQAVSRELRAQLPRKALLLGRRASPGLRY